MQLLIFFACAYDNMMSVKKKQKPQKAYLPLVLHELTSLDQRLSTKPKIAQCNYTARELLSMPPAHICIPYYWCSLGQRSFCNNFNPQSLTCQCQHVSSGILAWYLKCHIAALTLLLQCFLLPLLYHFLFIWCKSRLFLVNPLQLLTSTYTWAALHSLIMTCTSDIIVNACHRFLRLQNDSVSLSV